MNEIEESREVMRDNFGNVKKKVDYKGWALLFIVLLIGFSAGFMADGGFEAKDNVFNPDGLMKDGITCEDSINYMDDCVSFYQAKGLDYSLQCKYRSLYYIYCED